MAEQRPPEQRPPGNRPSVPNQPNQQPEHTPMRGM
jgi:hypothetical protein